ncbi:hypothetical protein DFJ77DRAFT_30513 [Powellomyces hirtus]|nr:hypothetical protein DFJ77DRAFT_30513 [Powellomyces hirtus]
MAGTNSSRARRSRDESPLGAHRPMTNGWGTGLIETWEDLSKANASNDLDNIPDPFKKRDKIPRGSWDLKRKDSKRGRQKDASGADNTDVSPKTVEKRFYDRWSHYDDVPIPTMLKQIIPDTFASSPISEYPPPPPSPTSSSERRSLFTRRSSRRRNGSSSPSPSPVLAPRTSSLSLRSLRNGRRDNSQAERNNPFGHDSAEVVVMDGNGAFVGHSRKTSERTLANPDINSSTNSLPNPAGRSRRKKSLDRSAKALVASSDFIFMDTSSDVGTVVYVADPSHRTVQKLLTVQRDGERTISGGSLDSPHKWQPLNRRDPHKNIEPPDQRVRFNEWEPIRPGSYLPKIPSERILSGIPSDGPHALANDKRNSTASARSEKAPGCRCTIM